MAAPSVDHLLVHKLWTKRRPAGRDRLGQPLPAVTAVLSNVPCRLTVARGGERFTERSRDVIAQTHEVFGPPGLDVIENDTATVKTAAGKTLIENANITLVRTATDGNGVAHHLEIFLEAYRSGAAGG